MDLAPQRAVYSPIQWTPKYLDKGADLKTTKNGGTSHPKKAAKLYMPLAMNGSIINHDLEEQGFGAWNEHCQGARGPALSTHER